MRVCPSFAYDSFHRNYTLALSRFADNAGDADDHSVSLTSIHVCVYIAHANTNEAAIFSYVRASVCYSFQLASSELFSFPKQANQLFTSWAYLFDWIMNSVILRKMWQFFRPKILLFPHSLCNYRMNEAEK